MNSTLVVDRDDRPADSRAGGRPGAVFERVGWLLFAAGAAIASALLLWYGRGGTFSLDELVWLASTPSLDLGDALDPHNGHLILVSRLLYKAILETIGTDYLSFRLLTVGAAVITSALFFAYVGRRIGKLAAFAPAMLLLVLGADYGHLLTGNGFTILGPIACGLGALLLLERDDRPGEIGACALLCLGVAIYTLALPFIAGIAIAILLRDDRWRRIWIVAIPALLYGVWWVYAQGLEGDPQSQTTLFNILTLPAWAFQSLSAMLGAVTGLDYDFGVDAGLKAGPTLAVMAILAMCWRIVRRGASTWLLATLGIVVSLWTIGVLAAGYVRQPDNPRYLYPLVVSGLVVAAWASTDLRWPRGTIIGLYAVFLIGVGANIVELRTGGKLLRGQADPTLTQLGALEIAGSNADPNTDLDAAASAAGVTIPYAIPGAPDSTAVSSQLALAARYGPIGLSPQELRRTSEDQRRLADSILLSALTIAPTPASQQASTGCRDLAAAGGGPPSVAVAPGDAIAITGAAASGQLLVRRFAQTSSQAVGAVGPGQAELLRFPADGAPDPWLVSASVPITVCEPR